MTTHKKQDEELRNKLSESSQRMKWTTPDGWEVQELIPVEYVMEIVAPVIHSYANEARISDTGRLQAVIMVSVLTGTVIGLGMAYVALKIILLFVEQAL